MRRTGSGRIDTWGGKDSGPRRCHDARGAERYAHDDTAGDERVVRAGIGAVAAIPVAFLLASWRGVRGEGGIHVDR